MSDRPAVPLAGHSVFVTGHTGFKGSWLSLWLAQAGARVSGYSLAPVTTPRLFEAAGIKDLLATHHEADLRDRDTLARAVAEADPDVVFHLAAQTRVLEGYREPLETISTNVLGTAVLLDVLRTRARPCAVVVVSSDKSYENEGSGRAFVEQDRMGGADPYSASKGAMELVVAAFRDSFFPTETWDRHRVSVATVRAGNVIGGGDWTEDALIPDTVRAVTAGLPVRLRRPDAIRPWQHVLEPLRGYLLLAARLLGPDAPALATAWNFGPETRGDASAGDIVDAFIRRWGSGTRMDEPGDSPPEATALRLSAERAWTHLGWRSTWPLDVAVARTADWYRAFADDPTAARPSTLADIAAFQAASSPVG